MTRFIFAIVALTLATGLGYAKAEDAPTPPTHKPLTLQDCINVRNGLRILDGYQALDKNGVAFTAQYKLGALRGSFSMDTVVLDQVLAAGETARLGLVKEMPPNGTPMAGTKEYAEFAAHDPSYKKFIEAYEQILKAPQPITIPHFKLDDLNIGDPPEKNPITSDTLSLLSSIIDH